MQSRKSAWQIPGWIFGSNYIFSPNCRELLIRKPRRISNGKRMTSCITTQPICGMDVCTFWNDLIRKKGSSGEHPVGGPALEEGRRRAASRVNAARRCGPTDRWTAATTAVGGRACLPELPKKKKREKERGGVGVQHTHQPQKNFISGQIFCLGPQWRECDRRPGLKEFLASA